MPLVFFYEQYLHKQGKGVQKEKLRRLVQFGVATKRNDEGRLMRTGKIIV